MMSLYQGEVLHLKQLIKQLFLHLSTLSSFCAHAYTRSTEHIIINEKCLLLCFQQLSPNQTKDVRSDIWAVILNLPPQLRSSRKDCFTATFPLNVHHTPDHRLLQ